MNEILNIEISGIQEKIDSYKENDNTPNLNKLVSELNSGLDMFPHIEFGFDKLDNNQSDQLLTVFDSVLQRENLKKEILS